MKNEIDAAVQWWKKALASPGYQDNGDVIQSALATWVSARQKPPTAKQIEDFGSALEAILTKVLSDGASTLITVLIECWPQPRKPPESTTALHSFQ